MALANNGLISIEAIVAEMGGSTAGGVNLEALSETWYQQTNDAAFLKPVQLSDWAGKSWAVQHSIVLFPSGPQQVAQQGGNVTVQVTSNAAWQFDEILHPAIANITASGKAGNGNLEISFNPNTGPERAGTLRVSTSQTFVELRWEQAGRQVLDLPGDLDFDVPR